MEGHQPRISNRITTRGSMITIAEVIADTMQGDNTVVDDSTAVGDFRLDVLAMDGVPEAILVDVSGTTGIKEDSAEDFKEAVVDLITSEEEAMAVAVMDDMVVEDMVKAADSMADSRMAITSIPQEVVVTIITDRQATVCDGLIKQQWTHIISKEQARMVAREAIITTVQEVRVDGCRKHHTMDIMGRRLINTIMNMGRKLIVTMDIMERRSTLMIPTMATTD
jgi:hypothetical protein